MGAAPLPAHAGGAQPAHRALPADPDLARLRLALRAFGAVFVVGFWPLVMVWPSGWAWHAGDPMQSHYLQMIVGISATLGVFLVRAAILSPTSA